MSHSSQLRMTFLDYYEGLGARKIVRITPSATLPQTQPPCNIDSTVGLIVAPARSILRKKSLPLEPTPSSSHHSHFAHNSVHYQPRPDNRSVTQMDTVDLTRTMSAKLRKPRKGTSSFSKRRRFCGSQPSEQPFDLVAFFVESTVVGPRTLVVLLTVTIGLVELPVQHSGMDGSLAGIFLPLLRLPKFVIDMLLGSLFLGRVQTAPTLWDNDCITVLGMLSSVALIASGSYQWLTCLAAVYWFLWIIY